MKKEKESLAKELNIQKVKEAICDVLEGKYLDPRTVIIDGLLFQLTCTACPEQYEVYYYGRQVGYLRLRGGFFSIEYPDCGGKLLFSTEAGQGRTGLQGLGGFIPSERGKYLKLAARLIIKELKKNNRWGKKPQGYY